MRNYYILSNGRVSRHDLYRYQESGEVNAGAQGGIHIRAAVGAQPAKGADAGHQKRHREARRNQHVGQAVGEEFHILLEVENPQ